MEPFDDEPQVDAFRGCSSVLLAMFLAGLLTYFFG